MFIAFFELLFYILQWVNSTGYFISFAKLCDEHFILALVHLTPYKRIQVIIEQQALRYGRSSLLILISPFDTKLIGDANFVAFLNI